MSTASKGYLISDGSVGTSGQVLQSNGPGTLPSWTTPATGTIGGTVAATQVAFGSGTDAIAGSSDLTFDSTNKVLALTGDAADCFTITNLDGQFIAVSPTSTAINVIDPLTPTNVAVIQPTDVAVGDGSQSANIGAGTVSVTDNGTSHQLGISIAAGNAVLRAEDTGTSTPVDLDLQIAALNVNSSPGTVGQVLTSQGAGAAPAWATLPTPAASPWTESGGSPNTVSLVTPASVVDMSSATLVSPLTFKDDANADLTVAYAGSGAAKNLTVSAASATSSNPA